jgi:alkylhydroperoxidase family enzyme
MARLRQVPRADVTDEFTLRVYDTIFGPDRDPVAQPGTSTGSPGDWYTVFALVPDVMRHAISGFTVYRSPDRRLEPALRTLSQARAGWLRGSRFAFSQHSKWCRTVGMHEDKVAAIPSWETSPAFDERERVVLAYTDALVDHDGRVPDALFARLQAHLSDEEILELTYIAGMVGMHAAIVRALRLEFDDRDDPVVEVPGSSAHLASELPVGLGDPAPGAGS